MEVLYDVFGAYNKKENLADRFDGKRSGRKMDAVNHMKAVCVPQTAQLLGHILYAPNRSDLSELPLMVYLHGAGERENDLSHLERCALPWLVKLGRSYDAIILCPQCPADRVWDNVVADVKNLIDSVVAEYQIKKDRICITGSSMGGFGTWMMAMTYRNFFSGIAPVAGGNMSWRSQNLISTPVFAAHGDRDSVVPIEYSRFMVDALKAQNANVLFKVLEGYGHNDGIEKAYVDGEITDWLLKQRRTDFTPVPETLSELF